MCLIDEHQLARANVGRNIAIRSMWATSKPVVKTSQLTIARNRPAR
jgi:hypothetical protein